MKTFGAGSAWNEGCGARCPPEAVPSPQCQLTSTGPCTQTHSWCPQQGHGEALLCSVTETSCPELTSAPHKLAFVSLCPQYWRQVYLITVLAMILAVFFAQIHPSYLTQQWHRLRSIIFCSVSGYGIIPTIHWVWLNGGVGASIVQVNKKNKEIRFPFAFYLPSSLSSLTLGKQWGSRRSYNSSKDRILLVNTIQMGTLRTVLRRDRQLGKFYCAVLP